MENNNNKTSLSNKYRLELNPHGVERRKQHRREQSERREIVRFGYDITTRRSGSDRRKYNDLWKGYDIF